MDRKVHLTPQGIEEIKDRLAKLKVKLVKQEGSIQRAIDRFGMNDPQYHDRLSRKMETLIEIDKYEAILKHSEEIECDKRDIEKKVVGLGDTVRLINHAICYEIQIVESHEANPFKKKVSVESPVGAAALGRKLGENFTVSMPEGAVEFKIEKIH
jgi:transcription elongation factor GreA